MLKRIEARLLFIALHIIWVRRSPEAPTMPPTDTKRISPIAIPAIEAATPDVEFKREIVIGMSAPPTRIAKKMPKRRLITSPATEMLIISSGLIGRRTMNAIIPKKLTVVKA